jgi:hypothetical protein
MVNSARQSGRADASRFRAATGARRAVAAVAVLSLGMTLSACSPFSSYVADHWPRWAGGLPEDVPPRPGAPGYDAFIAHGQSDQEPAVAMPMPGAMPGDKSAPANANVKTLHAALPTRAAPPGLAQSQVVTPQPATNSAVAPDGGEPAAQPAPEDPSVVKGGLY